MNARQIFSALAIALAGNVAMASEEVTQFNDAPLTLSRAEVKADLVRAKADGTLFANGEAPVLVTRPVVAAAARADVRAEARSYARKHTFFAVYGSN